MTDRKAIDVWRLSDLRQPEHPSRERWTCRSCSTRYPSHVARWRYVSPIGDDHWWCRACIEGERGAA